MSVQKFKPRSYSAEKARDLAALHAEKLLKSTAENLERAKKAMKEAKRLTSCGAKGTK